MYTENMNLKQPLFLMNNYFGSYHSAFLLQASNARNIKPACINSDSRASACCLKRLSCILENYSGVQRKLDAFYVFSILILQQQ